MLAVAVKVGGLETSEDNTCSTNQDVRTKNSRISKNDTSVRISEAFGEPVTYSPLVVTVNLNYLKLHPIIKTAGGYQ